MRMRVRIWQSRILFRQSQFLFLELTFEQCAQINEITRKEKNASTNSKNELETSYFHSWNSSRKTSNLCDLFLNFRMHNIHFVFATLYLHKYWNQTFQIHLVHLIKHFTHFKNECISVNSNLLFFRLLPNAFETWNTEFEKLFFEFDEANSEFVGSHYNCGQLSKFSFLNVKLQVLYFMVQYGAKSKIVAFVSKWQDCIRKWILCIQKTSIENSKWGLLWDNFRETMYGDPQRRHVTHNSANVQNAMWKCVFCSSKWMHLRSLVLNVKRQNNVSEMPYLLLRKAFLRGFKVVKLHLKNQYMLL